MANIRTHEEEFWIPWSFDYRGRVYPQNTQLNPTGTLTSTRASFLFKADEGPINEYHLAWHVATTYGTGQAPDASRPMGDNRTDHPVADRSHR